MQILFHFIEPQFFDGRSMVAGTTQDAQIFRTVFTTEALRILMIRLHRIPRPEVRADVLITPPDLSTNFSFGIHLRRRQ
jgi:hypothetical protein